MRVGSEQAGSESRAQINPPGLNAENFAQQSAIFRVDLRFRPFQKSRPGATSRPPPAMEGLARGPGPL